MKADEQTDNPRSDAAVKKRIRQLENDLAAQRRKVRQLNADLFTLPWLNISNLK